MHEVEARILAFLLQGVQGIPGELLWRAVRDARRRGGTFRDEGMARGLWKRTEWDACAETARALREFDCLRACRRCRTQMVTGPLRPWKCPRCGGPLSAGALTTPDVVYVNEVIARAVTCRARAAEGTSTGAAGPTGGVALRRPPAWAVRRRRFAQAGWFAIACVAAGLFGIAGAMLPAVLPRPRSVQPLERIDAAQAPPPTTSEIESASPGTR